MGTLHFTFIHNGEDLKFSQTLFCEPFVFHFAALMTWNIRQKYFLAKKHQKNLLSACEACVARDTSPLK